MQGEKTGDKGRKRKTKIIHLDAVSQMYSWPPSTELLKSINATKVVLKKAMKQEAMKAMKAMKTMKKAAAPAAPAMKKKAMKAMKKAAAPAAPTMKKKATKAMKK